MNHKIEKFIDNIKENKVVAIKFFTEPGWKDESYPVISYSDKNEIDDIDDNDNDNVIRNFNLSMIYDIFNALINNSSVTNLYLSNLHDVYNYYNFREMFKYISSNNSIEHLSLHYLCINTGRSKKIAKIIKNGSIKSLHIIRCSVSDYSSFSLEDSILCPDQEVFKIIADAVASSTSLECFHMYCDFKTNNIKYLYDAIENNNNQTLKSLDTSIYFSYYNTDSNGIDSYVADRLINNYSITKLQINIDQPNCNKLVERNFNFQHKRLVTTKKAV